MLEYKIAIGMATRAIMEGSVESTDVNNAVDHLHEIAHSCKPSGSRADLIDEVVTILKDMDAKRLAAHEALEAETIACSMLRHQVAVFPDILKAEIAAATEAARQSNAAQLKELQGKLSNINKSDSNFQRKNEVLELHNEVLSTEEKSLSVKYDDLMKKLNKSMLEKSNMRIVLNETRNNLNMTQRQVTNTEHKLMQLNEAMDREKEKYHEEKKSYTESLADATRKCDNQAKKDVELKKDLVILESKAVEVELDAEEKRKECCRLEARIKRMNSKCNEVQEQLKEGEAETERLQEEQKLVTRQRDEMVENYASKKAEMVERTEQYTKEIALCTAEAKKLSSSRKALKKEHKRAQDEANTQKLTLTDTQENVNTSKRTLRFQAEEASRLVGTNQDLELGLVQLQESHKVSVAVMKEQISKLKEQLVKERHLRQEVMEELLELQKVKEKEQVEQTRSLKEANAQIKRQKYDLEQMSQKTESLYKDIDYCKQQTDHVTTELNATKRHLDQMALSLNDQKASLEALIESQQKVVADIDKENDVITPKLKKSEQDYKDATSQYEAKKKDIILVKNKQTSLEERIIRAKKTLGKMHIPQEKLRISILRCRAYTRQHIREHSVEVDQLERAVLSTVCKLNVVRKENERLKEVTELLMEEIDRLTGITDSKEQLEAGAMAKLTDCRESLQQAWMEDNTMDETFARQDNVVLEEMNNIREASRSRQDMLKVIQQRFDEELSAMTEFVNALTR